MVNTSVYNTFFSKSSKKVGGGMKDISELFNKKKGLLVPTFANLIFQLGLTYYVMDRYTITDKKDLPLFFSYIGGKKVKDDNNIDDNNIEDNNIEDIDNIDNTDLEYFEKDNAIIDFFENEESGESGELYENIKLFHNYYYFIIFFFYNSK